MSKKPPKKQAFKDTPEKDYVTIMLEDIRSKLNLLVLKMHSQTLQWNTNQCKQNAERLGQIDRRLYQIEAKLDQVIEKVEDHDQALKKAGAM